jgi:hypothetical protein
MFENKDSISTFLSFNYDCATLYTNLWTQFHFETLRNKLYILIEF